METGYLIVNIIEIASMTTPWLFDPIYHQVNFVAQYFVWSNNLFFIRKWLSENSCSKWLISCIIIDRKQ
jgi:hypothetical protein